MSKLLNLFIDYFWQTALKPLLDRLDLWDVWFVAILAAAAYVEWAGFWHDQWPLYRPVGTFNVQERQLWSSLLLVVAIFWFAGRRVLGAVRSGRERRVTILTAFLALLCFAAPLAWGYGAYEIYRIVPFAESDVGIYLARLRGDREDQQRDRVLEALKKAVSSLHEVTNLSLFALPRWVADHADARRLGEEGMADVVLWGSVPLQDSTQRQSAKLELTPVNIVVPVPAAGTMVRTDARHVLIGEVSEDFALALLQFLVGYERSVSGQPDYVRAVVYFRGAKELLPHDAGRGLSPEGALRASTLFYHANALLGCASAGGPVESCGVTSAGEARQEAKNMYREAALILAAPRKVLEDSPYVEALNNLAFLEMADRETAEAQVALERANLVCHDELSPYDPNPWACLHVLYNLGTLLQDRRDYAAAFPYFKETISRFQDLETERGSSTGALDYWFLAQAHQAIAFGHAKQAERERDYAQRSASFENAQRYMKSAIEIMEKYGFEEPSRFGILRARSQIGRRKWQEARAALGLAELWASEEGYADFYVLSAIVEECLGNRAKAVVDLGRFLALSARDPQGPTAGIDYYKAVTKDCGPALADPG